MQDIHPSYWRYCSRRRQRVIPFIDGQIERTKTYQFNEHLLFIEDVASKKLVGWKPRRYGAGLGGKKQSGQLRFGGTERPFNKAVSYYAAN